jgi:hypothetical protein
MSEFAPGKDSTCAYVGFKSSCERLKVFRKFGGEDSGGVSVAVVCQKLKELREAGVMGRSWFTTPVDDCALGGIFISWLIWDWLYPSVNS